MAARIYDIYDPSSPAFVEPTAPGASRTHNKPHHRPPAAWGGVPATHRSRACCFWRRCSLP